jgi:hypothetical protein
MSHGMAIGGSTVSWCNAIRMVRCSMIVSIWDMESIDLIDSIDLIELIMLLESIDLVYLCAVRTVMLRRNITVIIRDQNCIDSHFFLCHGGAWLLRE